MAERVEIPGRLRGGRELETQKTAEAAASRIRPLKTERAGRDLPGVGNDWTRRYYDGDFHLVPVPAGRPAISLVFVQSRDGNTGASNPETLGGGPTDKHLIYEGLSRVAADAVLAGASTASGRRVFFSVWHPELVRLRLSLGLPRHPAQVILSRDGHLDLDRALLFNLPDVPVFVLAGPAFSERIQAGLASRPWITMIPLKPGGLPSALTVLSEQHGIQRISCIGGRKTATALLDLGVVQDLLLTTAPHPGGEPHTPYYVGARPPVLDLIVRKREIETEEPILFEHLAVSGARTD